MQEVTYNNYESVYYTYLNKQEMSKKKNKGLISETLAKCQNMRRLIEPDVPEYI